MMAAPWEEYLQRDGRLVPHRCQTEAALKIKSYVGCCKKPFASRDTGTAQIRVSFLNFQSVFSGQGINSVQERAGYCV